jgi:hypothetical protein
MKTPSPQNLLFVSVTFLIFLFSTTTPKLFQLLKVQFVLKLHHLEKILLLMLLDQSRMLVNLPLLELQLMVESPKEEQLLFQTLKLVLSIPSVLERTQSMYSTVEYQLKAVPSLLTVCTSLLFHQN